jgi:beta-glucosidase
MTDWETIPNLVKIGVAEDLKQASFMAISNNVDMDMTSTAYIQHLETLLDEGKITIELIDESVRRVLRLKHAVGLLDEPYLYFDERRQADELLKEENRQTALALSRKSMVLLENKNDILPLDLNSSKLTNIAVIGPFAKAKADLNGWWFSEGKPEETISIFDGLEQGLAGKIKLSYAQGVSIDKFSLSGPELIPEAINIAEKADLAIVVLGEEYWMSGEGGGTASLQLPGLQEQLLEALAFTGTPLVTVIVSGRPYVLTDIAKHSNALLQAWMPGTMGGKAVADILLGDYNPAGRLPVTFPYHAGQVPIYYNYKRTSHTFDAGQNDLRYSTTYRDVQSDPLYCFGYGLSYSRFEYSNMRLSSKAMTRDSTVTVSIDVKNVSDREGVETVQLYIRDEVASVSRPFKELKDFTQVQLSPQQTQTIEFVITSDKLHFIGKDLNTCIEDGSFTVFVGQDSSVSEGLQFRLS